MTDRLVLGSGTLAATLIDELAARPGSLTVVTDDERRVDTLQAENVQVAYVDPTDPAELRALDRAYDSVLAVDEDVDTALGATRAAREVFPDAMVLAYVAGDVDRRAAFESLADRVVDLGRATATEVRERVLESGYRMRQLRQILSDLETLAVVTHDNPDPDAIGSGMALARIAERLGCDTEVCYYGEITHQENRAFVNLLDFDLRTLEREASLEAYDGIALVDHSRPGVNDQLPEELTVDIVIDHHPPRGPVDARYVDLRSEVGATSTLLTQYIDAFDIRPDEAVATGLLFGIRIDTSEFTREVSPADFEAAASLVEHADLGTLQRIESPSVSADTIQTLAAAIRNRDVRGAVLLTCVGELAERDALAQAADYLLNLEDVETTLVYGYRDETIFASARTRVSDLDLGETMRDAFGLIGSAGGHNDMAGAQITLGMFQDVEDAEESLQTIVENVVTDRFMSALRAQERFTATDIYGTDFVTTDQYLRPAEEREAVANDDSGSEVANEDESGSV
jgi:nanoRNase/pAp phosphatase (c-di-AMP/oligoRNAs hydrolase)